MDNFGLRLDALGIGRTWNTNGTMGRVWMLCLSRSLKHERDHRVGMDALVIELTAT